MSEKYTPKVGDWVEDDRGVVGLIYRLSPVMALPWKGSGSVQNGPPEEYGLTYWPEGIRPWRPAVGDEVVVTYRDEARVGMVARAVTEGKHPYWSVQWPGNLHPYELHEIAPAWYAKHMEDAGKPQAKGPPLDSGSTEPASSSLRCYCWRRKDGSIITCEACYTPAEDTSGSPGVPASPGPIESASAGALLPCPFCGGEARPVDRKGSGFVSMCMSDDCIEGPWEKTEAESIAAWNMRTLSPDVKRQVFDAWRERAEKAEAAKKVADGACDLMRKDMDRYAARARKAEADARCADAHLIAMSDDISAARTELDQWRRGVKRWPNDPSSVVPPFGEWVTPVSAAQYGDDGPTTINATGTLTAIKPRPPEPPPWYMRWLGWLWRFIKKTYWGWSVVALVGYAHWVAFRRLGELLR